MSTKSRFVLFLWLLLPLLLLLFVLSPVLSGGLMLGEYVQMVAEAIDEYVFP
ncbi:MULTISPECIES: hypothetical protein [Pirellulaceae]|uniref:hypothetical protein n=1 Tax=Pirellulaceae TaxID=2691357 RepID=UPI001304F9C4|nr:MULTISPECIES: hypothetical protein [Pirellulaceae]